MVAPVGVRRRPLRSSVFLRAGIAYIVVVVLLGLVATPYWVYLLSGCLIFAIATCGQDLLMGVAGQASFGGAAFMAIGAFTAAKAASGGLTLLGAIVLAALVGAAIGLIVGLPSLRISGFYLLLATLALQEVVQFALRRFEGSAGALYVNAPSIGALDFDSVRSQYWLYAVVLGLVMIFVGRVYRETPGRAWRAIQESELAASTAGVNTTWWKLSAFVWSSALTSLAGALYAFYIGSVSDTTFSIAMAISIVAMVFVGGRRSILGSLIGATLVTLLPAGIQQLSSRLNSSSGLGSFLTTHASTINVGIFSLALLVVLIVAPEGIAGALGSLVHRRKRDRRDRMAPAPAAPRAAERSPLATTNLRERPTAASAPSPVDGTAAVAVDRLRVRYPNGAMAVQDVSLTVAEGESVLILGRNGAGKTSLLRAIAGFLPAERVRVAGGIKVFGQEISSVAPAARASRGVVIVPEREKTFPSLTVRDHLLVAGGSDEVLDMFPGLQRRVTAHGGDLSGGERQMLALAMAVSRRPKLLLIDEMSLGLAPVVVQEVQRQLDRARRELGLTVVLVDQDATTVLRSADRACLLHEGRLVDLEPDDEDTVAAVGKLLLGAEEL